MRNCKHNDGCFRRTRKVKGFQNENVYRMKTFTERKHLQNENTYRTKTLTERANLTNDLQYMFVAG